MIEALGTLLDYLLSPSTPLARLTLVGLILYTLLDQGPDDYV